MAGEVGSRQPGRTATLAWRRIDHAARLGRYRCRARLHRTSVRCRELWRPRAPVPARGPLPAPDLSAVARDLLHVLDLLRLGRPGLAHRLRVPDHLCRPDHHDRSLLPPHHAGRAPRQGAEHHLDRRLHRRTLRQVAGGRGDGGADRHHQHDPLHRPPAQSGVGIARTIIGEVRPDIARQHAGGRRHRAVRGVVDGGLRRPVRHAPYRRHRAPGRPDARGRRRVAGQARRLPGRRRVRDVLDVRRAGRAVHPGDGARGHRRDPQSRLSVRHDRGDDAAVAVRDPAAAAAIPRHRGREPRRARGQAGGVAVPAVSRADQPVRRADRARRHADVLRRRRRQRHVCAGAAARRPSRM